MRRSAIVLVLLCAALGVLAAMAIGHTKAYPGNLTLNLANFRLSGKLSSGVAACEKNRYVTVYVVGNTGQTSAAASDTTNGNGDWITGTGFFDSAGEYIAKIRPKTLLRNGEHTHKCKAVSKRRDFGG